MILLSLREPVSALTHALGCVLGVAATAHLWSQSGRRRERRPGLMVYGVSLVACYAASASYHAYPGAPETILFLRRLDHLGIYLLIAGTYTPVAASLLPRAWSRAILSLAWLAALGGGGILLGRGLLPTWLSTSVYLSLGWCAVFVYRELGRRSPPGSVRPILFGGIAYTVGALINLFRWPLIWPGVFGAHELFHLFVMAGTFHHYRFILNAVALGGSGDPSTPAPRGHPAQVARPVFPRIAWPTRRVGSLSSAMTKGTDVNARG